MKKNNRHSNWILRLAGILFCLTLFSVHLTSGLYARYTTSASGSDSARVARFDIKQTGELMQLIELDVWPGFTSEDYTIVLENNSEVAVAYTVSVERLTENLPLTLTIDGESGLAASGTMQANAVDSVNYRLQIAWGSGGNDERLSYEIDAIRVTVRVEQID